MAAYAARARGSWYVLAVNWFAPFNESEQLDLQPMLSGSTSKPVAPVSNVNKKTRFIITRSPREARHRVTVLPVPVSLCLPFSVSPSEARPPRLPNVL